ncbi:hypothetical protein LTR56_018341 [Elasticomyces elasticus]|nr:hypothetical protein LTR22_022197 [Elasticomyces elasticus]KAK3628985.1 hypothetical protein LTR56_018341 [Elasticomyces elasticus]KAK4903600.1 hypothetical protein LTR49_026777 [Elasticomyces elasticus]KAK5736892.1 hypothetical protein LTS12_026044 [Elasticomyces elasticus]
MAAIAGKFVAQKLLSKHMDQYKDKQVSQGDDPYFALIPDPKRPNKMKKVRKQIPAYIPEADALILATCKRRAYRLDMCLFNLFGIRFGWEAVIGLIPFAGDAFGLAMAYLILMKCQKVEGGLPSNVRMKMVINILVDFVVGLVPFIGDLADAAFKCNTKNVALLERHLDQKYKPSGTRRDERDYAGVDKATRRKNRQSGIFAANDPPPATVFEDLDDDDYQQQGRRQGGGGGNGRQETGSVRR